MGRPKGSRNIPWDAIVERLRRHPGRWMMVPEMAAVPERMITVIRERQRRALRLPDAIIRVRVRASVTDEDGNRTVTLKLKYEPKETP